MVIHHTQRKLQKSGASAGQDAEIYVEKRRIVPGRGGEREREKWLFVCVLALSSMKRRRGHSAQGVGKVA